MRDRYMPDDRLTRRQRRALSRLHGPTLPASLEALPAPAVLAPSPASGGRRGILTRTRSAIGRRAVRRAVKRASTSPALAPVVAAATVVVVGVVCLAILAGALLAGGGVAA